MTTDRAFEIRRFGVEETAKMTAISADVGWNQPEKEIEEIILRSGKYLLGAFRSGELVGTAAAYPYPDGNFAYVNEVIVLGAWRKRGAATQLLEELLPLTSADYPVLRLCATAMGRPIYEKFGFKPFATLSFGELSHSPAEVSAGGISRLTSADLPEACRLDAENFGARRPEVLEKLLANAPDAAWKLVRDGRMAGFIIRASMNWFLQCRDAETFTAMSAYADSRMSGVPMLIREEHVKYLPSPLEEHFKLTLMQYGDALPLPGAAFSGFLPDIG